ncbi:MAG: pyridoxal phosphate-dependent aminotransferase [Ignavibacterium sp.]|nr:pyridoxal phosphate-dependent aminotransferase [Ignavibacterium sp.]MDW8375914.1 pyridoxal phosphate-dependent aminotransferase [Ignavibacteriales bacterium]
MSPSEIPQTIPINSQVVDKLLNENRITDLSLASIREIKKLVDDIERETNIKFVRMEMGIPGLPASKIGIDAEIKALKNGVASIYPDIYGIQPLKNETSRFVKLFLDVDVSPESCVPTTGSTMGSFAAFLILGRFHKQKDTILLINPGFPVHYQQLRILDIKNESFDVYDFRGEKLRAKLESYFEKGNIAGVLYSNPNNPSWICFTENELKIIGELCTKYDVIPIEDLAYFAMDFRKDLSKPGQPPFQATVAKYTEHFILTISSSKAFSYAGQRIAMLVLSDKLFSRKYDNLKKYYLTEYFGHALVYGNLYAISAGITHSTQYALAEILKAVNDGNYNFVEEVREYGVKAKIMKELFIKNGFRIVYDKDEDEPIADGFYFTISYPGMNSDELLRKLLLYGISAISLRITASERIEGIRSCVSLVKREQFKDLEERLSKFREDHSIK